MIIQKNDTGRNVLEWQKFLISLGYSLTLDGIFGTRTEQATKSFQSAHNLEIDGKAGTRTITAASSIYNHKFNFESEQGTAAKSPGYYPPRPGFGSPSDAKRKDMFGAFEYKRKTGGEIQILGNWTNENIVSIQIPALAGKVGSPSGGIIRVHKKAAPQFAAAFEAIESLGLSNRIISFAGAFYPRFIRGSTKTLSNHSFGSAIDINAPENWLNQKPARIGAKGCLLELVPIFNAFGFFWGGHYQSRLDGMHFEIARLMSADEIEKAKRIFLNSKPTADIAEKSDSLEAATVGNVLVDFTDPDLNRTADAGAFPESVADFSDAGSETENFELDLPGDFDFGKPAVETVPANSAWNNTISEMKEKLNQSLREQTEKATAEIKDQIFNAPGAAIEGIKDSLPNFSPVNFPAFIPKIGLKKVFGLVFAPVVGFFSTVGSYAAGLPQWFIFLLGIITGIAVYKTYQYFISFDSERINYIGGLYKDLADPTKNNPIPTTDPTRKGFDLIKQFFE